MGGFASRFRRSGPQLVLAALLIVSAALRMLLVSHGGQFFWLDEVFRLHPCLVIMDALRYPNHTWTEIADTIANQHLHTGFLLVGIPATLIAHRMLAFISFSSVQVAVAYVLAPVSVASIALVYALARRLRAPTAEALLAASLMAGTNCMFYYSRHVLPYDSALVLALFALWWGLDERSSFRRSLVFGLLAGTAYMTYFGYLTTVLTITAIVLWRERSWWRMTTHAVAVGAGFAVLPLAMHVYTMIHSAGGSLFLNDVIGLMQRADQGTFEEGWRVPWIYLWYSEHTLLLVWIAGVAVVLALSRRGGEASRARGLLWVTAAALIYAQLTLGSTILHKAVVLGRFARQLVPFLCLAAAAAASDLVDRRYVSRPLGWVAIVALGLQVAINFSIPLRQRFPPEVQREVAASYDMREVTRDLAIVGPTWGEPVDRSARFVLMNTAVFLYPPNGVAPPIPGRVLLRYAHPLQFIPYQYEVYDAAGRAVLAAADISMRLIDTWDSGETPP